MTGAFGMLNRAVMGAFGTTVQYQPAAYDSFDVKAVVDRTSDEQRAADGVYLRLFVNLEDFAAPPAAGDEVRIEDVAYTVFDVSVDPVRGAYLAVRER